MSTPLLQVKDLHTSFKIDSGEGGFEGFCDFDEFADIGFTVGPAHLSKADGVGVDVGEMLEEHCFALHHR